MKKGLKLSVAVLAVFGLAFASSASADLQKGDPFANNLQMSNDPNGTLGALASEVAGLDAGPHAGETFTFDMAGTASWDVLSDPDNDVLLIDVAAGIGLPSGTAVDFNGVGWDITVETVGASWLSEAVFYFDDNIAPDQMGLFLTVGVGNDAPGVGTFNSGGVLKLDDVAIPVVNLPDGILRLELFESYDDVADAIDANISGTLTIQAVPEPATLALFGMGALALIRRRR